MIPLFEQFWVDKNAQYFFISGQAGTGKTTSLAELTVYLQLKEISFVVCAFTHKACDVLAEKLPPGTPIETLHHVLRKRPTINDIATQSQQIEISRQHSQPDRYEVILIDEFSQVGERDLMDLVTACEDPETGEVQTKVVFIGDRNQVPPVGDLEAVVPHGPYWLKLTKVWRQAEGNELLDLLTDLVTYIEGAPPKPLKENANFRRGVDLVEQYNKVEDPILLAFTNAQVQELNAKIQGRDFAVHNDKVFSPTTRFNYVVKDLDMPVEHLSEINKAYGDGTIKWDSKYKTLEHLIAMPGISFYEVSDEEGDIYHHAVVFGHHTYKVYIDKLKAEAAAANKECEGLAGEKGRAKLWAQANYRHPAARKRAKAWRDYLTFKDCVICLDFPHALTVHKSQGSTYKTVLLDTDDLYKCAAWNFNLYLRLMYVAISRASDKVYTN